MNNKIRNCITDINNVEIYDNYPLYKNECIACKNKKYCCIGYETIISRRQLHSSLEKERNKIISKKR
tara:strand:+ start:310 stop:510 length:201 start_codon:yes stop_codon:yes gene_type:complete